MPRRTSCKSLMATEGVDGPRKVVGRKPYEAVSCEVVREDMLVESRCQPVLTSSHSTAICPGRWDLPWCEGAYAPDAHRYRYNLAEWQIRPKLGSRQIKTTMWNPFQALALVTWWEPGWAYKVLTSRTPTGFFSLGPFSSPLPLRALRTMSHIDAGVAPELRHSPTSSEFADEKAPGKRDEEELAHHEEELLDVYVLFCSLTFVV